VGFTAQGFDVSETPVGRMTGNVLIRFLDDAPFAVPGRTGMSERSVD
jgi:hypothetical protein